MRDSRYIWRRGVAQSRHSSSRPGTLVLAAVRLVTTNPSPVNLLRRNRRQNAEASPFAQVTSELNVKAEVVAQTCATRSLRKS